MVKTLKSDPPKLTLSVLLEPFILFEIVTKQSFSCYMIFHFFRHVGYFCLILASDITVVCWVVSSPRAGSVFVCLQWVPWVSGVVDPSIDDWWVGWWWWWVVWDDSLSPGCGWDISVPQAAIHLLYISSSTDRWSNSWFSFIFLLNTS